MTPEQIHRTSIAGIIATQLGDVVGCGCCSHYQPTGDQTAIAEYAGLPVWTLVMADILIKNGVKL